VIFIEYIIRLEGSKKDMENSKEALLETDGSFGVYIEEFHFNKIGLFKYKIKVTLNGTRENIKRFNKRVSANYMISQGNILGLLDYI
jgi:hypothetical protein